MALRLGLGDDLDLPVVEAEPLLGFREEASFGSLPAVKGRTTPAGLMALAALPRVKAILDNQEIDLVR